MEIGLPAVQEEDKCIRLHGLGVPRQELVLALCRGVDVIPRISADTIQHLEIWRADILFMNARYENREVGCFPVKKGYYNM